MTTGIWRPTSSISFFFNQVSAVYSQRQYFFQDHIVLRAIETPFCSPAEEFTFPSEKENRADEVLLYRILFLVSFVQSAQRLSGGDAYKLKLIELVLLFLPPASKLRIHDHICLWNCFLPIRELSLRA